MCFIDLPLLQFAENPSAKRKQTIPLSSTFGQPALPTFQPNLWPISEARPGLGAALDEVTRNLKEKARSSRHGQIIKIFVFQNGVKSIK